MRLAAAASECKCLVAFWKASLFQQQVHWLGGGFFLQVGKYLLNGHWAFRN